MLFTCRRLPSWTSTSVPKDILLAKDLRGSVVGSTESRLGICGAYTSLHLAYAGQPYAFPTTLDNYVVRPMEHNWQKVNYMIDSTFSFHIKQICTAWGRKIFQFLNGLTLSFLNTQANSLYKAKIRNYLIIIYE
uniref:Uncharacterized protein n=1 Tax=Gossypium raimondii TaxID=29730 RepID=A0A0D2W6I2_GOSRA|nr:hypothetical protein B456_013G159100 [Gossypium raimondii]